ncbi:MAG: hypothetical protein ACJ8BW_12860 [Ktedonobacteraceae bacterium]
MRNTQLYIGAIVLGVLALIVGVMFIANILLGYHPTRAYIAFGVGIILLIVGIVGMVSTRSRSQL